MESHFSPHFYSPFILESRTLFWEVKVELNFSCEGLLLLHLLLTLRDIYSHTDSGITSLCHWLTIFIFPPAPSLSFSHTAENVILCTSFFPLSCITVSLQDSNFCLHIAVVCHLQRMSFSMLNYLLLIESCPYILSPCCKTFSGLVHKAIPLQEVLQHIYDSQK